MSNLSDANEAADLLLKIKKLVDSSETAKPVSTTSTVSTASSSNKKEILKYSIRELRRHYDSVSRSFDNLRSKALALLVGEFAIVTFLFSAGDSRSPLIGEVYGAIFLGVGVFLLATSFILLLWVMSPSYWSHPPDTALVRRIDKWFKNDPSNFLEYLNEEYCSIIEDCIGKVSKRANMFKWGIYAMSAGIFIVVVIKFGGSVLHFK